jgi:hypothetical protein
VDGRWRRGAAVSAAAIALAAALAACQGHSPNVHETGVVQSRTVLKNGTLQLKIVYDSDHNLHTVGSGEGADWPACVPKAHWPECSDDPGPIKKGSK